MVKLSVGPRRKMISVAYLVHKLSLAGNGISVTASRVELFPEDCWPQTTICGKGKILSGHTYVSVQQYPGRVAVLHFVIHPTKTRSEGPSCKF